MKSISIVFVLLALLSSFAFAVDVPEQDFCVANFEPTPGVFVNGEFCKDPTKVNPDDFLFTGLNKPGNFSDGVGCSYSPVSVTQLPGLNTLDISMLRIDCEPYGVVPPHINPRASEILVVLKGTLYVGFITSNPENRFFSKILKEGDVYVFPIGLIQIHFNVGKTKSVAISGFNSQNPGYIPITTNLFGSTPPINDDFLSKAFQIDNNLVDYLQSRFSTDRK